MITINNLRDNKIAYNTRENWHVRVDRSSPLGNPFYMHSEEYRDSVCDQYDAWLSNAVLDDNPNTPLVKLELRRLIDLYKQYGKLELYCWCAPKRCHAESIKRIIEKIISC